jgi:hypothetical protein
MFALNFFAARSHFAFVMPLASTLHLISQPILQRRASKCTHWIFRSVLAVGSILWCFQPIATFAQSQQLSPSSFTLSGQIRERGSAESVIGVSVILAADSLARTILRGTRTNKYGFFSLPNVSEPLWQGSYFLVVRGVGYRTFSQRIVTQSVTQSVTQTVTQTAPQAKANTTALSSLSFTIELVAASVQGKTVTVQADRDDREATVSTRSVSTISITPAMLKKLPALGGEVDVFRALQLMPGVKSASEVSSGLYVRGGSPDQNLTLLDGVPLYNPSHLGGLLSVFNNEALSDVKLIKGGFPAEYGGRLSSVVDVTMREGTKERLRGSVGLSLIALRATVEAPLWLFAPRSKSADSVAQSFTKSVAENADSTAVQSERLPDASFMISGRRMYLDALRAVLSDTLRKQIPGYYFYDFNAKLNVVLSESDRLYVSVYAGYDVLNQPDALDARFAVQWGNASANLRWTHVVSPSVFTSFSAMYTNYDFSTSIATTGSRGEEQGFSSLSRIRDWIGRGEVQWFASPEHTVKSGFEATAHTFRSAAETNAAFGAGAFRLDSTGGSLVESIEAGVFVQDEWQQAFGVPELSLNAGCRLMYFQRGGYFFAEPRLSGAWQISDDVALRGAFALANQFVHLIIRNDLGVPSDVWFPSTETVLPSRALQYTLGGDAKLLSGEFALSAEVYYKASTNLYEFRDDAQFSLLAPLEQQFTRGTGEGYGLELLLNKNGNKEILPNLSGWLGYTLSWAWRTFADLNGGVPFAPRFDRRHDLSLVLAYTLDDAWELGLSWVYATGQAFTMPAGQYDFAAVNNGAASRIPTGTPRPKFQSTERNAFRLPAFHKLDVSLTHRFTWFGLPFQASLSIYNLYNRANAYSWSIRYRSETAPDGSLRQVPYVQQLSLFPIIPTLGLSFTF